PDRRIVPRDAEVARARKMMTMTSRSLFRSLAATVLAVAVTLPAGAQSVVGKDMFIGGQPTEKALRELKAKGVTTLVNLRMPEEMARVGFDEAALVKEL